MTAYDHWKTFDEVGERESRESEAMLDFEDDVMQEMLDYASKLPKLQRFIHAMWDEFGDAYDGAAWNKWLKDEHERFHRNLQD